MPRLIIACHLILALALPALAQTSTVPGLTDPLPPTPNYTDPNQPPLPSTLPGNASPDSTPPGSTPPENASPSAAAPPKNITATGRTMPPTTGRSPPDQAKSLVETEMMKAQKATDVRNKAWDTKMRKTMGSICIGC